MRKWAIFISYGIIAGLLAGLLAWGALQLLAHVPQSPTNETCEVSYYITIPMYDEKGDWEGTIQSPVYVCTTPTPGGKK